MAGSDTEVGARLVLSGRSEFVNDAKASTAAIDKIGVAAKQVSESTVKASAKFSTLNERAKAAGVKTEETLGATGKKGGEKFGRGILHGALMSEGAIRHAGRDAGEGYGASMRESAGEYFKTFAGPLLGIFAAEEVKKTLTEGITLANDYRRQQQLTTAALKSTAGASGQTAKSIDQQSASLAELTAKSDVATHGMLNMLLTFPKLKGTQFKEAGLQAANLAAKLGIGLPQAARMLGKTLNDPVKSINGLSRVGIVFSKGQTEMIKKMVATGNIAKAQSYILEQVNQRVGGAAAAAVTPTDRMKHAWEDVQESIGKKALPVLNRLSKWFAGPGIDGIKKYAGIIAKDLRPYITMLFTWIKATGIPIAEMLAKWIITLGKFVLGLAISVGKVLMPVIKTIGEFLGKNIIPALKDFGTWVQNNTSWLKPLAVGVLAMVTAFKLWAIATGIWKAVTEAAAVVQGAFNAVLDANPIGIVVLAIIGLAAAFVYAYKHSETFRLIVQKVFHDIKAVVETVVGWIGHHWRLLLIMMTGGIGAAVVYIIDHWSTIKKDVTAIVNFMIKIGKGIGDGIKWAWDHSLGPVFGLIKRAIDKIIAGYNLITGKDLFGTQTRGNYSGKDGMSAKSLAGLGSIGNLSGLASLPSNMGSLLPGVSAKTMGHNAGGTNDWRGGLTIAGENGAELLDLPQHSKISNASKTQNLRSRGNYSIKQPNVYSGQLKSIPADQKPIHIHVMLQGKQIAEAVYDETARLAGYME